MKVEIWSDVVCPFCYIGKRKFENALKDFDQKGKVEIVWRSFQLDPDMEYVEGQSVSEYLAKRKGVSVDKAREMNNYVSGVAKEVGLEYDFDKAILNNTLDAHRLLHLAAEHGVQTQLKEALFAAYYTQGKNIGDTETLVEIGTSFGLNAAEIRTMLQSDTYKNDVRQDQYQANQVGAQGVPFFVFNSKYAVSGAQPTEVFKQVLDKVWDEEKPVAEATDGGFCTPDGVCN
ncbi:DsbA family oxidoreductase [Mucilaginibacter gynuensis]|uniref:DsbA family oxidoreductase n=1 Tax=Mucilaginibacter gynuensis TaxID=1302236 RepID=A0ABP8G0S4_9SPHI